MEIINHGYWVLYTPEVKPEGLPKDLPANVQFVKRITDGMDWYTFVQSEDLQATSVKMIVHDQPGRGLIVGAATKDAQWLYPANATLIEVVGYSGDDPQAFFGGKLFENDEFKEAPPYPIPPQVVRTQELIASMQERIAALEAK